METLKSHFLDEETLVIVTADHSHTMVLPGTNDLMMHSIFHGKPMRFFNW